MPARIIKCGGACYVLETEYRRLLAALDSGPTGDPSWLDQFSGTPLWEQAATLMFDESGESDADLS